MNEQNTISEAMRILGSRKSEKKAASSRANLGKRKLKPIADFRCDCKKCPDAPKTYCPRGRAILRRRQP